MVSCSVWFLIKVFVFDWKYALLEWYIAMTGWRKKILKLQFFYTSQAYRQSTEMNSYTEGVSVDYNRPIVCENLDRCVEIVSWRNNGMCKCLLVLFIDYPTWLRSFILMIILWDEVVKNYVFFLSFPGRSHTFSHTSITLGTRISRNACYSLIGSILKFSFF